MNSISSLVSVVIPTFNRSELLPRAIRSVQAQSYEHWELIVVDDASKDGTQAVLHDFIAADSRIRLITHTTNRGVSTARNTGIDGCKGEFICFLDSDDEWKPEKLEQQLQYLDEHSELSGCITGVLWEEHSGSRVTKPPDVEPDVIARALVRRDLTAFGAGSCLMTRAETVRASRIRFEESWAAFEDWDFVTQVARAGSLGQLQTVLTVAHRAGNRTKQQWSPQNVIRTAPLLLKKYESEYVDLPATRAKIYAGMAISYERLGDTANARRNWFKAWKTRPAQLGFLKRYLTTFAPRRLRVRPVRARTGSGRRSV